MYRPTFRLLDNCNIFKFIQSNRNQSTKLHRLVTELVGPLESSLNEMKTSDEIKSQLVEEMNSVVEVGGAEAKEGEQEQTIDEVCSQNQKIAINIFRTDVGKSKFFDILFKCYLYTYEGRLWTLRTG